MNPEALRQRFIERLTVDSPHQDRRRWDYNQAIFSEEGRSVWSSTELDMVMLAFDRAVQDIQRRAA